MAEFSAVAAATEGFKILRRPVVILIWAAVYFVMIAAIIALVIGVLGAGALGTFMGGGFARTGEMPDWTALAPGIGAIVLLVVLLIPLGVLISAVLYGAVSRAVLEPSQSRFGYVRFGADEFRLAAVYLAFMGLVLVYYAICGVVGLLAFQLHWSLLFLVVPAAIAGLIFFSIRLSLSIPRTLAEKRISIFESWSLTRGHFWGMLGAYILAWLFTIGITLGVGIVLGILSLFVTIPTMMSAASAGAEVNSFSPAMLIMQGVQTIVQTILGAIAIALMGSPAAAIYRDLTGIGKADVF